MRRFTVLLLYACSLTLHAQLLTNSGAAMTVQAGAQLTVQGEVLNAASGTINNSGTIDLNGNWTNNAGNDCFGNSEGTVILNGAGQQIGGSSYTMFNHLALAGGDVTLLQNAFVGGGALSIESGVLALGSARLFLNSRQIGITNSDPAAMTRTTGFVVSETGPGLGYGRVRWDIADHAPAVYTVPFGSDASGDFLPLNLDLTVAGSGSSAWFTFATYPTDPFALPNNRPLPAGMTSFTDLAGLENAHNVVDRFWVIDTEEYLTEPTAALRFTYRDSEWNAGTNAIVESTLQAQRWDGALWSNPPIGTVNTLANTVTAPPVNLFAQVWALVQSSTPLPVELLAFDAEPDGDDVRCTWSTASEQNNDFFTVERSRDGVVFDDIGEMEGAGNSQQVLGYSFLDPSPYAGLSYYRLRQTDFDGTETWSQVVAVVFDPIGSSQLAVYPDPARDQLMLAGLPDNTTRIVLFDATGRLVRTWSNTTLLDDLGDLERGVYTVGVESEEGITSVRVVLE
jgi:hypothetical protein